MRKIISILLILVILAFSVQPTYNFKFTDTEALIIYKALYKLPYEEAAPIIDKIRYQANDTTLNPIKK